MPGKQKGAFAEDGCRNGVISFPICSDAEKDELEVQLQKAARQIAAGLSGLEAAQRRELLGGFVSELFLASAEQERRVERRQKQADGIAAAKARGVRFGRTERALPDNFHEICQAWQDGELTLREAANACGMPASTFHDAAIRRSQAVEDVG